MCMLMNRPAVEQNKGLAVLLDRVRAIGALFVGMANGPFLLVLRASDPQRFIVYADKHPTHNVHITLDANTKPNIRDRNL
jgi:hypothetical protein